MYTVKEFTCKRDGMTIRGREYIPAGEKLPAVILSHGFGSNKNEFSQCCKALAEWGYAAFCFDFCGGCADDGGDSDGTSTEMTVFTERADLCAVMDYVKANPNIDKNRLFLLGASQGGFVSALTAAFRPCEVAGLILFFPALCIPDDARRGGLANASYDIKHVPEVIDCGRMKISRRFHEEVVDMDPMEEIRKYPGRVIIFHGTADGIVNYKYSEAAREAYGEKRCKLLLLEGAGHGFTEGETKKVLEEIKKFL